MNSQDLFWAAVGPTWWTGYAIICGLSAVLWFRIIMKARGRDAFTVAHMLLLGGFILGAFVRANSACEPLSAALLATGGAFSAVLISTGWASRPGTAWSKLVGIVRDAVWGRQKHPLNLAGDD